MSHRSSPDSTGEGRAREGGRQSRPMGPKPTSKKTLFKMCFPLQTTFPHNFRDADSPPGGRNPELSLHSPAGKCLQKTWVGWDALIRTSTIVLSVWGDVGKYKWGPKANPYTPDLRTPDCAKGCSAFFAHVNSRRPQSHKGGHHSQQ